MTKSTKLRWRAEHDTVIEAGMKRERQGEDLGPEQVDWAAVAAYVSKKINRVVRAGQVRERYRSHISPLVNKDEWEDGEVRLILKLWTQGLSVKTITGKLEPDALGRRRTDLKVKNLIFGISRRQAKYAKLAGQVLQPTPTNKEPADKSPEQDQGQEPADEGQEPADKSPEQDQEQDQEPADEGQEQDQEPAAAASAETKRVHMTRETLAARLTEDPDKENDNDLLLYTRKYHPNCCWQDEMIDMFWCFAEQT